MTDAAINNMPASVPMVDLRAQFEPLIPEIMAAVEGVLRRGQFILGENVEALEREVASYIGAAHAVGCASGTDALLLALRALDIGPGDEVIVPTFTFVSSAEAVRQAGATPVFVDVDEEHFCIDVDAAGSAITPRTRAIIPVHLYGLPADMPALLQLAERNDLAVIEDCAQAIGAHIDGRKVGSQGHFGCFSFFPSKNLGGAGDGGMITTNSAQFAERLRALRNHGSHRRYFHEESGYNSRLDELQAVILRIKLRHLPEYIAGRRQVAQFYHHHLRGCALACPREPQSSHHVYHQFTIKLAQREKAEALLQQRGIATAIYYPLPLHRQAAFADLPPTDCPRADRLSGQVLSLPIYPELTESQVARIADSVREALESREPRIARRMR